MDEHYDRDAAKATLLELMSHRLQQDESNTAQLATRDMKTVHVRFLENPKCLKAFEDGDEESTIDLAIFRMQGILCGKSLPPVPRSTSTAAMERARPHLRQSATITGLGLEQFDNCVSKIESMYMAFYNALPSDTLDGWNPGDAFGFTTVTAQTRYFDRVNPSTNVPVSVGFTESEDPIGTLAAMEKDGFVHGDDNAVEYRARVMDPERNTYSYKHINPITFKIGDIVELSISFAAYPTKSKKYVFVPHVKGILLLSQAQREKAAILRMRARFKPDANVVIRKRKSLYPDDDAVEDARAKVAKLTLAHGSQEMQM
ncbi:hypothetical protein CPC08DRAFT_770666 [Agrocybe pediades]|nr:hypothetical protein CPC08DRAFT_770666 [Agrocybe pediades]